MALATGTRLGPFEVVDSLGKGGMGEVYRARDAKLGRDVAIKVLPGQVSAEARSRFEREARAVAALNHPHIVTIHDIAQADGLDFIVMELVAGRSLDRLIPERGLPIDRVLDFGAQIASALEAAHHARIVHRDIKPANVMVTDAGQVKVLDFGIAKVAQNRGPGDATLTADLATVAGTVMGTVAYMSPEQAQGRPVDERSDVFSLGAVLYEMLAGRRAFQGETQMATLAVILAGAPPSLVSIRPDVPTSLARLVADCLQKDSAARPTATAIVERLASMAGKASAARRPAWMGVLVGVAVLGVVAAGGWLVKTNADARWVRNTAIPEVRRLVGERKYFEGFVRTREVRQYAPADPELEGLWKEIASTRSITSDPPGAEVAVAPYGADENAWAVLGRTPLTNVAVPNGILQVRVTKAGYAPTEDVVWVIAATPARIAVTLLPPAEVPTGLVRATGAGGSPFYLVSGADPVNLTFPDFWIGRFEVTNREYKAFVAAGGYQRREYWTIPFTRAGHAVSWEDAQALFRDATGQPGPATWQVGSYPEGQDDWPVTGVSWYEANAYLAFAGRHMPTLPHWQQAAGYFALTQIVPRSNFGGRGVARVGSLQAINRFGTQDLAGNVKEWTTNSAGGDLRYIVGGAWDEPAYMFGEKDARPAFERAANFGIRAARFDSGDRSPDTLGGTIVRPTREYGKSTPVSTTVFEAYRRFYAYDHTPLTGRVMSTRDTAPDWRVETVTFPAAYGGETMTAHVFLPTHAKPPFEAVVYMSGASQFTLRSSQQEVDAPTLAHVLRSGRAVVLPIVKGAFERGTDEFTQTTPKESALWRDYVVAMYKDLARTIDYLETRPDIARDRIGFVGMSRGAALSPIVLALEPERLKTAVLMVPGLYLATPAPEVDPFNFLPRVTQPVLAMNGRFDFIFPERFQVPFFTLLAAPADRKRRVSYDTGHNLPPTEMIKETLDWLDRTLGPVSH